MINNELETKIEIPKDLIHGKVLCLVNEMRNILRQRGHYGPYFLISSFEVEKDINNIIYEQIGISETQRILEIKEIIGWNKNKKGIIEKAHELEDNKDRSLILVQTTGLEYEENLIDNIIEKVKTVEDYCKKIKSELNSFIYNRQYYSPE